MDLKKIVKEKGYINLLDKRFFNDIASDLIQEDIIRSKRIFADDEVFFEGREMPFVPIPLIFSKDFDKKIKSDMVHLFKILEKIIDLYLHNKSVQEFFNLDEKYVSLIKINCGYSPRIYFCRIDFTLSKDNEIQIYEFNTASPAGMVFSSTFGRACLFSNLIKRLKNKYHMQLGGFEIYKKHLFAKTIKELFSKKQKNIIAILNSKYNTLNNELRNITKQILDIGVEAIQCYVEDLNFNGQKLTYKNKEIDLCINKFKNLVILNFECPFSKYLKNVSGYIKALSLKRTIGVNSFQSTFITESKSAMAFLKEKKFWKYFTKKEICLIEKIIPDTYQIRSLSKKMLQQIIKTKNSYVLKKSIDTRGNSLIIGKNFSNKEWQKILIRSFKDLNENYVIQKFSSPINIPLSPSLKNFNLKDNAYLTLSYFLFKGQPVGPMARISKDFVTNVGQGGIIQPCILLS